MALSAYLEARYDSRKSFYNKARIEDDGTQVCVWSKDANYGFYNLQRFEGGVLTASSFRKFFSVEG